MATTKGSTKKTPAKQPAPAAMPVAVKPAKPAPAAATKAKPVVRAAPAGVPKATSRDAAKATTPKSTAGSRAKKAAAISPEQRRNYVEVAAFYIAERRGFAPGNLLDDWVQAEVEIDRLLAGGHLGG